MCRVCRNIRRIKIAELGRNRLTAGQNIVVAVNRVTGRTAPGGKHGCPVFQIRSVSCIGGLIEQFIRNPVNRGKHTHDDGSKKRRVLAHDGVLSKFEFFKID